MRDRPRQAADAAAGQATPPEGARARMAERVDKPELVQRVARRLDRNGETVAEIVDGFLEEIYVALKGGDSVSLRGLAPSMSVRGEPAGCSSSTRRSGCARCLVGRRPTAGRCELHDDRRWEHEPCSVCSSPIEVDGGPRP
jgi:hypothetical protein